MDTKMNEIVEKSDLEETKEVNLINMDNTSPGQLQDVTMDSSYAIGYRSPCIAVQTGGSTSPGQGRSVREFEEQMAALRKENFNLKLRIYFLEEKIPGYSSSNNNQDGHETLLKQNVDLKVESEVLRKELQEKQILLCEAARAMDLMEKQQKQTEEQSQAIIDELNEKIRLLESDSREFERATTGQLTDQLIGETELGHDIDVMQKVHELEGFVKQYETKTEQLNDKIRELETTINQKDEIIIDLETKIKELEYQNSDLQEQLDLKAQEVTTLEREVKELNRKLSYGNINGKNQINSDLEKLKEDLNSANANIEEKDKALEEQQKTIEELRYQKIKEELLDHKRQLADKLCTLEEVETNLQQKTKEHEKACSAIQKLLLNTKDLQVEIEKLRKVDHSYQNGSQIMEDSLETSNLRPIGSYATQATTEWASLKSKLEKLIEEKDVEIKNLKLEVKKKTSNLQNLVNKELWEKNREIERLTKLLNKHQSQSLSVPNSPIKEIDNQLQQSFTDSDYNAALERNKILQKRVDTLIQKLCTIAESHNTEPLVLQLKIELKEARDDAEKAHHWGRECAEVCEVLKDRLEELAGFLNSLLEDDVLGALAVDKRHALKKAINRSLEMSRSLNNMSLSRSRLSMGDEHSLIQLSSVSALLNFTTDNKENQTFNSHVEDNKQQDPVTVEDLKAEIKALKKELGRKKVTDSTKKERRSLPMNLVDNQSESEAWSEPDRKVSLARIGLEEAILIKSNASNIKDESQQHIHHVSTTESESDAMRKSKNCKLQKKLSLLEQMVMERDNRILEVQCELVESDNRLKEENLRLMEVSRELEEYKKVNEMLEIEIARFKAEGDNYNELKFEYEALKRQFGEKESTLEKIQQERDNLNVEIRLTEMKVENLQTEIENLKLKHEQELQATIENQSQNLDKIKTELTAQWEEKLKQQDEKFQSTLARDWVSRTLYTDLKHELETTQKRFNEAQSTIEFLHENEAEMNKQLIENEKCIRNLRKSLDETTLQASRAVLERTKAMNEKSILQAKYKELLDKVDVIQQEKLALVGVAKRREAEIAGLEREREKINQIKSRKPSSNGGGSEEGYTSEEIPIPFSIQMLMGSNQNNANVNPSSSSMKDTCPRRRHDNSSPDLGIESDAGGRTSSVELITAQLATANGNGAVSRLKTIEIPTTSSDENGRNSSGEQHRITSAGSDSDVEDISNNNQTKTTIVTNTNSSTSTTVTTATTMIKHDCAKVDQENEELRRKLRHTKRALEDTWNKLRSANQRKEKIERDLRRQIDKTQEVLKNVRTNLENEIEFKKK